MQKTWYGVDNILGFSLFHEIETLDIFPVWKKFGKTALIMAAFRGHVEIVKLFLNVGSNVNEKDNVIYFLWSMDHFYILCLPQEGFTSLILTGYSGRLEVVELLLKAGADVNARNFVC